MSAAEFYVMHPEGFGEDGSGGFCVSMSPPDPRPWAHTQQPPGGQIVTCGLCGYVGVWSGGGS